MSVLRRYFTMAIVESFDSRPNLHDKTLENLKVILELYPRLFGLKKQK